MPQFGRPMLHALDAVTTTSGPFEAVPTSVATGTGTDPDPDPQVIEAASSSYVCIHHFVGVMVILMLHVVPGVEYSYDNVSC